MDSEIYIANRLADTLDYLSDDERERVAAMIDSLAGDGWKNSQIVAHDDSQGGGLRASLAGGPRLLFRYAPESHAIIVTSIIKAGDLALAMEEGARNSRLQPA